MSLTVPNQANVITDSYANRPAQQPTASSASFASVLQQASNQPTTSATDNEPVVEQDPGTEKPGHDAVAEFMAWMQMTPAEQLRARILKELGLTEEELDNMDIAELNKIEQLIAQRVRDELELQNHQPPANEPSEAANQ